MRRLARAGVVLGALLLAAGCALFSSSTETPLQLDFSQTLPVGWEAIGTWQEVNIDGDDAVEYLLLFSYDQGQVGAAIYDSQISPDLVGVVGVSATPVTTPAVELVPVPLQPFGYFRPYRLLPSFWSYSYGGDSGHGFLALPQDSGRVQVIQVETDSADQNGPGSDDGEAASGLSSELVIRGGDTHLTFVWWRGPLYGYGITQLAAEGGFRGVDWETWVGASAVIEQISGLYPLTDYRMRSLLCREILYTRSVTSTLGGSGTSDLPAITFSEQDQGLKFCREPAPVHPFYPEGVVMAYLEIAGDSEIGALERETALAALLTPGVDPKSIEAEAMLSQLSQEIVNDVATYVTVPALPSSVQSGEFMPTTTVCVETAQNAEPNGRRWLVFTLRYQPPDLEARLPDRWTISGATEMPSPASQPPASYCESIFVEPTE
jgi:hypothetical protein